MTKQYKSDVYAAIHQTMEDMYGVGLVDKITMRKFDDSCLVPVEELPPEEIRRIRESQYMSQPVFARHLNVSKNLVSDWERGVKKPGGPALLLLSLVRRKGVKVLFEDGGKKKERSAERHLQTVG
jgi:putative transcriptional regulator